MSAFAENKIFASLMILIALACAALAYLVFSENGHYNEALDTYRSGMEKLSGLRGLAPYRNLENLKKVQDQVNNYRELTAGLQTDLLKRQGAIEPMEPAVFQGRLRDLVSKTVDHANQRGVQLPLKFYLGFETYENQLPKNEITGLLNWQLSAVEAVVNRLIDLKVTSITAIVRPPLPGEIALEPSSKELPLLKKYPFEITFLGYPGNVQSILNDLGAFPQFTILRALRIENEQLKSPARAGVVVTGAESVAPAEPAVDKIIIGKEKVTASLIVDLVQFTPKQIPKK